MKIIEMIVGSSHSGNGSLRFGTKYCKYTVRKCSKAI